MLNQFNHLLEFLILRMHASFLSAYSNSRNRVGACAYWESVVRVGVQKMD